MSRSLFDRARAFLAVLTVGLVAAGCSSSGADTTAADAPTVTAGGVTTTIGDGGTGATWPSTTVTTIAGAVDDASPFGEVLISGQALAAHDPASADTAKGQTAPELVGTDFSGAEVRIEADGRPKVVYFLAHWCPHCNNELPEIVGLVGEGAKPDDIDVYLVSTSVQVSDSLTPPAEWFDLNGWDEPVLRDTDTSAAFHTFGASGLPFAVYLDGDGLVLDRVAGAIGRGTILQTWETLSAVTDDDGVFVAPTTVPPAIDESATGVVTVDGSALPLHDAEAAADAAVGEVAPTLIGTDFDGNEVTIGPDGRAKVVYLMAHWCWYCNEELPRVVDLLTLGANPDDLDIYIVSTAVRPDQANYPPQQWLTDNGWDGPVLRDSDAVEAWLAFGGSGLPFAVHLDGDNVVVARTAGEQGADGILENWAATVEATRD